MNNPVDALPPVPIRFIDYDTGAELPPSQPVIVRAVSAAGETAAYIAVLLHGTPIFEGHARDERIELFRQPWALQSSLAARAKDGATVRLHVSAVGGDDGERKRAVAG